ncbi:uncharacterized protein AB9W97_020797 isoform 1-T3 [Spinachia spinachia]
MHPCPVCPKSFPSPYKLRRHYVLHTGQKPFICTTCGKSFTQSDHLKTHLHNVHRPRLPTDCLQKESVTRNQQENDKSPSAKIKIHSVCDYNVIPSTVSSSPAFQPEWKRPNVAAKTGNPPQKMPRVNDTMVTWSCISNVIDPITPGQVDSANENPLVYHAQNGCTSKVHSKSYSSSPHLWIQSPTRQPKQLEGSRKSGQTVPKQAHSKEHLLQKELSSSRGKMTLKHQCATCLKTFCSPSKLQRHSLIHTGQKPYSCTVCRKAFRQKVHLKSHLSSENRCSLSVGAERKKQGASGHPTVVKLEPQCKIAVKKAAAKPEQSVHDSSQCLSAFDRSEDREQQDVTQKSLKPSHPMNWITNRLEGDLRCPHEINRDQEELGTPTTEQDGNNVEMSVPEEIQHSPKPNVADPLDLNVNVKPESWSVDYPDYKDPPPPDGEVIPSAHQQGEPPSGTSKRHKFHRCPMCLKCFPSTSKLQRHMMTHTGQRPFGCEMCGKRFRQKTHLRVHCRTHLWSRYHKQRSLYINRPPSRTGGSSRTVTVLEMLLQEDFEPRSGHDVVSLKRPPPTPSAGILQSDNAKPDKLSPRILKKSEVVTKVKRAPMAGPMQNPRNVQHKCLRCSKSFPSASKLERHEMVHTGLKPFHCVFCGKAFTQAAHLKTHQITHCERKPSKPVNHRQPGIGVRTPRQNVPVNKDGPLSNWDGTEGAEGSASLCTRRPVSITKVSSLLKTNSQSNIPCKKRKVHSCRICFRSFGFRYKLSRHLATHCRMGTYKCTWCSKTFTQFGHLKAHEQRCGHGNRVSHCIEGEVVNTNHLRDERFVNLGDCTDLNADATSDGHSFPDIGSTFFSEATRAEWLAVTEGSDEENNQFKKKMSGDCVRAACSYDQDEDHYSSSFPSELSVEIDKLVQNNTRTAPPFSQYKISAHNVKVACPPTGVMAVSDGNKLLDNEPVTSLVGNQMQPENSWCPPLNEFKYDTCAASHESEDDLEQYFCLTNVQRNRCNICFKHFVSPSKLERHFLIHTGLRPFRCDICGKTFTQSAHVRTHRLTH